ncbi:MAG TPA: flagellar biosynthesis protein FlhF [Bacillota bacterium]|nr:flagellar biosynthesis protein FlhF [Bacillota bacterium]
MRVKRYVADTIHEAILQVKSDLGRDALILHTKTFKVGGFLGLFAKKRFEVIAALDENNGKAASLLEPSPSTESEALPAHQQETEKTSEFQAIQQEMAELRAAIKEVASCLNQRESPVEAVSIAEVAPAAEVLSREQDPPTDEAPRSTTYSKADLQVPTYEIPWGEPGDPIVGGAIQLKNKPTVVALVGPTGVGKTTTIAKIAAHFVLFERVKVALVTIDTYRIAAVEQLKTYAEIINIPVSVVFTREDYQEALHNYAGYDLLLVDTAGRSQKNQGQIQELQNFFNGVTPDEVHLVISATTKLQDMVEVVESFADVGYNRIIFSKLDETNEYQSLMALAGRIRMPLSYITTGQNVPDDIEVVTPDRLAVLANKEHSHA